MPPGQQSYEPRRKRIKRSTRGLDIAILAGRSWWINVRHDQMPRFKTWHSPAELLADEFLQEKASALGRLGRAFEASLAALAAFDAGRRLASSTAESRQMRASLVAEASLALWHFVVQREACGLRDLRYVLRDYRVPPEVSARMGAVAGESPPAPRRVR